MNTKVDRHSVLECGELSYTKTVLMVEPSQKHIDAYVALVRLADRMHAEVSSGLLLCGLTATQFSTLKVLRTNGELTQREIAKLVLKTEGNLTQVLDRLEALGYIQRARSETDRRQSRVSLTDLGAQVFDREYPDHLSRIQSAMDAYTVEECQTLLDLLAKATEEVPPTCSVSAN